jgi:hypothetical protein
MAGMAAYVKRGGAHSKKHGLNTGSTEMQKCIMKPERKTPNDQAHLPAPGGEVERKKDNQI